MFTGIVQDLGKIIQKRPNQEGTQFCVQTKLADELNIGDSISINGACQTVTEINNNIISIQTVHTSLEKTNLGELKTGGLVNLELALRLNDRLGGHLVSGHINAKTRILNVEGYGNNYLVELRNTEKIRSYIVNEGSICINGVSLTISKANYERFSVSIIPHTWENTTFFSLRSGDLVNIEVDLIAKYLENLVKPYQKTSISLDWLAKNGF